MTAKPQPHDALFKAAFTDPEHAAAHLRVLLPPALAARIDFESLYGKEKAERFFVRVRRNGGSGGNEGGEGGA